MKPFSFRKLASNFIFLSGGEVISKIFTFAAFVYLARVLGPVHFGYLEFTLAVMVIFTLFVDFGSSPFGAREIAKDKGHISEIASSIISLRFLFAVTGYLLLILLSFFLPEENLPVQGMLLLYGVTLFGIPFFMQWVFQGLDKMRVVATGSIFRYTIFALGVFIMIHSSEQLWVVALVECISVGGFVFFYVYFYRSRIGHFQFRTNLRSLKSSFVQTAPIGLSELAWAFIWYSTIVLLGFMVGGETVGWFGVAHRTIMALHTFAWLYFYNLFPSISRCEGQSEETLQHLLGKSIMASSWTAVFLVTVGMILAKPFLITVYGPDYVEAAATFKILIWVVAFVLLFGHYNYTLIAYNLQRLHLICCASAAGVSVLLSVLLIPRFEAYGAAVSILASTILCGVLAYFFVCRKITLIPFGTHLVKPLIAGALTVICYILLPPLKLILSSLVVILLYGVTMSAMQPSILINVRTFFVKNR